MAEREHSLAKAFSESDDEDKIVKLYMVECSKIPRLSQSEEVELAIRVETGKKAQSIIETNHCDYDTFCLLRSQIDDGKLARGYLVGSHGRLVISIAKKYMGMGMPFPDLIQEGNLGAMKAANKFDYRRGFRFSTYAKPWIKQTIILSLPNQGRTIPIPVETYDIIRSINLVSELLEQELGRKPTINEVASKLQIRPNKIRWFLQVSRPPYSLDEPVEKENGADGELFGDFIEDYTVSPIGSIAENNELNAKLIELTEELPPREAKILKLRFGLSGNDPHHLEAIASKYGLSRERIRQLEKQALNKLREREGIEELREYLK